MKILAALYTGSMSNATLQENKQPLRKIIARLQWHSSLSGTGGLGKCRTHSPDDESLPLVNLHPFLISTPTIRRRAPDHAVDPNREFALLVQLAQEADVGG